MTGRGADPVRAARAWLSRAVEPGNSDLHRLLGQHGPVGAMRLIQAGHAPGLAHRPPRGGADRSVEDLAAAAGLGVRLVTPEDAEWPAHALRVMQAAVAGGASGLVPPQALWVRGRGPVDQALARAVAVIGSRQATGYGTQVAADLGYALAGRGWTILSGGGYGIDAAAHRGALAADGTTVAILPGGLATPYPAGHARLFDRITGTGLLLSEWPPDVPPRRHRFLLRNRLVAALSSGTVVVEAGARSSALSTAGRARELGRAVMAVPGPVTSAVSAGGHHLLQHGDARLVTNAADVLHTIGAPTGQPPPP